MAPIALHDTFGDEKVSENKAQCPAALETGEAIRLAARAGTFTQQTSGSAPTYLQANLIAMPAKYASDFRLLCQRNPVPCPLLAESNTIGSWNALKSHIAGLTGEQIAENVDLRH